MEPDTDFERGLREALAAAPRVPGVDWSLALAATIMRVLDRRDPGFRLAVQQELEKSAASMETSDIADERADAPSVRELAASWVFTAEPSD